MEVLLEFVDNIIRVAKCGKYLIFFYFLLLMLNKAPINCTHPALSWLRDVPAKRAWVAVDVYNCINVQVKSQYNNFYSYSKIQHVLCLSQICQHLIFFI